MGDKRSRFVIVRDKVASRRQEREPKLLNQFVSSTSPEWKSEPPSISLPSKQTFVERSQPNLKFSSGVEQSAHFHEHLLFPPFFEFSCVSACLLSHQLPSLARRIVIRLCRPRPKELARNSQGLALEGTLFELPTTALPSRVGIWPAILPRAKLRLWKGICSRIQFLPPPLLVAPASREARSSILCSIDPLEERN